MGEIFGFFDDTEEAEAGDMDARDRLTIETERVGSDPAGIVLLVTAVIILYMVMSGD